MCWSLEVSVGTSIFSYAVALFLIVRGDWSRKFYGGCLLGVCAMQWAEQHVKGLPMAVSQLGARASSGHA